MFFHLPQKLVGGLAPLAGLACLGLATSASAQSRRFELTWQAPAGCPTRDEVAREVDELIADSAGAARVTPIVASGVVASDPGGYALTLTLREVEAQRSRHIGAPSCEELAHAAALIVAIAIDPTILERRADTNNAGPAQVAGTAPSRSVHCRLTDLPLQSSAPRLTCPKIEIPAPPPTIPSPAPAPTVPGSTPHSPSFFRFGFGSFVAVNVLPNVNLGMNLLGAIQGKHARLEVAASALSSDVDSKQFPNSRNASFSLYRLAPRGCGLIAGASWAAGPCVGMEVGLLSGKGSGVDYPHTRRSPWLASSFGGMFELYLSSSSLLLFTADLGVPWLRQPFELAGEQLYRPYLSGSFGINLAAGWH